jgi:signal transduction histidine kinase
MIALNFETTDVRSVIDKADSGMEPLAMAKNLTINIDIASDLPHVKMDREKIIRALGNLIGNAVKFTPAGGHIKISAQPSENGVRISVADTGPGIPKEDLDAIFDKFQQVAMTSYNKIKGTGLGLAIVKHIINAHGGRVWAESKTGSETGNGSIFIFVLPV